MGNTFSNQFPVAGKTVVVTGGSQGMGLEVARQLAAKGANVVLIARTHEKLKRSIEYVMGASTIETQRFHFISADLTSPSECTRAIEDVESWNGSPPDIVWCVAGTSEPTLFIETPVPSFESQMKSNYFTSVYIAHAVMTRWLKPNGKHLVSKDASTDRHLIFTSSVVAFFTITGYAPYSPAKAALRALSDTLSQEMNLYQAAHPDLPRVRIHTVFPGTILSEGYELENRIKPEVTKWVEEFDEKQTPAVVAKKAIKGLENGQELIATDLITDLARRGMLGNSGKGGFWRGLLDWFLTGIVAIAIIFVRWDMDKKVRTWGRKYGPSGRKVSTEGNIDG